MRALDQATGGPLYTQGHWVLATGGGGGGGDGGETPRGGGRLCGIRDPEPSKRPVARPGIRLSLQQDGR